MFALLNVFAGVAWDPTIRGVLVVLVGVVVLFGSIWMIVATNVGARLGTLIALAALFAWFFMMGSVWWIYGIGWIGDSPSWEAVDINSAPLAASIVDEVADLPERSVLIDEYGTPLELVQASDDEDAKKEFSPDLAPEQEEGLSDEELEAAREDQKLKAELTTYSEVASVSRDVIEDAGMEFGGWNLLSTADAGEAQTQAAEVLIENDYFGSPDDFLNLEAYDIGGKESLGDDPTRWDRITLTVENAFTLTHPIRYSVVEVQAVITPTTVIGEAPPRPRTDQESVIISVIMQRNLGDRRLPPALFTIASLIIFLVLVYTLHTRDKKLMARREAFAAGEDD
ncbi:MAG: hypothetical protein IH940_11500 [Acidobacteria bacterium]|nr:hypothetical protein [Acidobacteriota bacterium]